MNESITDGDCPNALPLFNRPKNKSSQQRSYSATQLIPSRYEIMLFFYQVRIFSKKLILRFTIHKYIDSASICSILSNRKYKITANNKREYLSKLIEDE